MINGPVTTCQEVSCDEAHGSVFDYVVHNIFINNLHQWFLILIAHWSHLGILKMPELQPQSFPFYWPIGSDINEDLDNMLIKSTCDTLIKRRFYDRITACLCAKFYDK